MCENELRMCGQPYKRPHVETVRSQIDLRRAQFGGIHPQMHTFHTNIRRRINRIKYLHLYYDKIKQRDEPGGTITEAVRVITNIRITCNHNKGESVFLGMGNNYATADG